MTHSVDAAFQILTGRPTPRRLADELESLTDPLQIRAKILGDPRLFAAVPELRLAYEIAALREARTRGSVRLVIGAAGTSFPGWVSTNENLLNLLKPEAWLAWLEENSVEAMLSEHVWEHLDEEEGLVAARTCHRFLAPGKRLRIAVPDAFKPDPAYHELCKTGGRDGHKVFYNYKTLSSMLSKAGFHLDILEYWSETGAFHEREWSSADGHIGRCRKHDPRNKQGTLGYTSLIVDAIKPEG